MYNYVSLFAKQTIHNDPPMSRIPTLSLLDYDVASLWLTANLNRVEPEISYVALAICGK